MNFMNAMSNELNSRKTLTENGAVAYESSGKELLDFLFATTALRKAPENEIKNGFAKVFYENPLVATRFIFWLRDCRGGNGERRIFRVAMQWMTENKPEIARNMLKLFSFYGRWDDLWCLLDTSMRDKIIEIVKEQIEEDLMNIQKGNAISGLCKWLPSSNTSSKESCRYARIIREGLGLTECHYRKRLSFMRKYLDVVERKMSANEWDKINYQAVPSKANLIYGNAFMRHDEERRKEYLEALINGEAKINAGTLQPHEIVNRYNPRTGWHNVLINQYDETLEQLWKALPQYSLENSLVIRDGSSSMTWSYGGNVRPLDVASALAIYMADHNTGIWKDKFITFSAHPKIIDLSNCNTLRDKLINTYAHDECENTNIYATMQLILKTAVNNHCSQEDMPTNVVIVSDMQFDGRSYNYDESLFDRISKEYKDAGYQLPRITFWNVAGKVNNTIPMQQNKLGLVLTSGFSVQLLQMVMSGKTDPYEVVLETINSPRYDRVEEAFIQATK